jgi:hypothetical protein
LAGALGHLPEHLGEANKAPILRKVTVVDHAIKMLSQSATVRLDIPARIYQVYGRQLTVEGADGLPIPVHRGQSFRRIADSVPVIADSC